MNEPRGFRGFIDRHNVKIFVVFGLLSCAGNLIVYRRRKIEGANFEKREYFVSLFFIFISKTNFITILCCMMVFEFFIY